MEAKQRVLPQLFIYRIIIIIIIIIII